VAKGVLRGRPAIGLALERRPWPRGRLSALRRSERGTALVEFALIAPLLFLLLFGIIDFGRALNYYNQVTQLAGQGARAAAVNRMPDGSAITSGSALQAQLVNQYTAQPQLKQGETVCITQVPANFGAPVQVRVSYNFQFLPVLGAFAGLSHITLSSTQTERAEVVPPDYSAVDQNNQAC
jgi:Flp pilus assembly protein TadG